MAVAHPRRAKDFGISRTSGVRPAAVTDQLTIESVSLPEVAAPGSSVPLSVAISCQAAALIGTCEAFLRVSTPIETLRVPQSDVRKMGEGTQSTFRTSLTMAETDMPVTIEAVEVGTGDESPNVEDTRQITVRSGSQAETLALNWGPWVVGGGAVGVGGALALNRDPLIGAGVGAGAGALGKVASQNIPAIRLPSIGLVELLGAGIVGILGLMILRTFTGGEGGVEDFAGAAGTAAGKAGSALTGGAGRLASAVK